MGRYASKKNKRGPDVGSSDNRSTFSWTFFLVVYLTAFTFFRTQMEAIVLWNFVWTLGGLIDWFDMTLGVFLFLTIIAGWDIASRGASYLKGILFWGTMILTVFLVGSTFTDPAVATAFLNAAIATAGLTGFFILVMLGSKNR